MKNNDSVQELTNRHTKPLTDLAEGSTRHGIRLRTLLSFIFALLGLFITMASLLIFRFQIERQLLENLGQRLYDIVAITATQQDGDALMRITSSEDPEYYQIHTQNTRIKNIDPNIAFIYTMRKDDQGIYFAVDAGDPNDPLFSAFGERYSDPSPELVQRFETATSPFLDSEFYTNEYGTFLSAFAPIYATTGERAGMLGVDIAIETIDTIILSNTLRSLPFFALLLLLTVGGGWILGDRLARVSHAMIEATGQISMGDFHLRIPEKYAIREITDIARNFNTMTEQLESLIEGLERRVQERTQELATAVKQKEKRAVQLETVAEVAQAIVATQSSERILQKIVNLISNRFGFYHVGIFLMDDNRKYAILRAANSDGGSRMLERGHQLEAGKTGIVGFVASSGYPRIALDVGDDSVFFNNPDLPDTRSEIALPLKIGERIIGVLDVQSREASAFKDDDQSILSILADQVSVAIENARLFDETKKALSEAELMNRQFIHQAWNRLPKEQRFKGVRYSPAGSKIIEQFASDSFFTDDGDKSVKRISIPIELHGESIGTLSVKVPSAKELSPDQIDIIRAVADRVALSAENARLFEGTTRRAERERLVSDITSKIRSTTEPETMIKIALNELKVALGATHVQLLPHKVSETIIDSEFSNEDRTPKQKDRKSGEQE
jgi:GAF domain-containing protein/HAMP domain-containing protein